MRYLSTVRGLPALIGIVVLFAVALVFDSATWIRRLAVTGAAFIAVLSAWHEWSRR